MSASTRRILSFLALSVAAGLLFVADGTWYFDRNVLDSSAFAEHAAGALESGPVRRELSREIVDAVEDRVPALSGRRGDLEAAADQMMETPEFRRIFRAGVLEIHRFALDDRDTQLLLDLQNVEGPLTKAAERVDPALASSIPANLDARVAEISEKADRTLGDIQEFNDRAGGLADLTLLLGLGLLAASVALAVDRGKALIRIGLLATALGLIYVIAYYLGRSAIASELDNEVGRDAVKGTWDAVLGGLRDWNIVLILLGLALSVGTVLYRSRRRPVEGW